MTEVKSVVGGRGSSYTLSLEGSSNRDVGAFLFGGRGKEGLDRLKEL